MYKIRFQKLKMSDQNIVKSGSAEIIETKYDPILKCHFSVKVVVYSYFFCHLRIIVSSF